MALCAALRIAAGSHDDRDEVATIWPLAFLPLVLWVLHRIVISREEAYLERRFGDVYRAYRHRVRRWF